MNATCIGLDIAKQVFQVHGVDEHGHVVLRKTLKRKQVLTFFANLPFCLIGVEAGGGSHYWARELTRLGHEVKLIAPQFVAPYRKSGKAGKNDQNDAEAIWALLADLDNGLPVLARQTFTNLAVRLRGLNEQVTEYDQRLQQLARGSEPVQRLMEVEGIDPVTATAVVTTVGDGHEFHSGREFAAWLGLTPRQSSSGGKSRWAEGR